MHPATHPARARETAAEMRTKGVVWTETSWVKVIVTQAAWESVITQSTARRSVDLVLVFETGNWLWEWSARHPRLR
jgi:hypothetical protein